MPFPLAFAFPFSSKQAFIDLVNEMFCVHLAAFFSLICAIRFRLLLKYSFMPGLIRMSGSVINCFKVAI